MRHLFVILCLILGTCACTSSKRSVVVKTVPVPIDTTVAVTVPEKTYQDSTEWWDWPNPTKNQVERSEIPHRLIGKPKTENQNFFWDWPTASTQIEFRDSFIHVETTCKPRIDTVRIRDTLQIKTDCPCPNNQSQTTRHGKGWWLAAALAFVWLMTLYSQRKPTVK